jgi:hypothetical protein
MAQTIPTSASSKANTPKNVTLGFVLATVWDSLHPVYAALR